MEIQKSKSFLPAALGVCLVLGIVLANFYLFFGANSKLESYRTEPPFLRFDFTDSYLEDRSSQAPYLADGDSNTEWRKLRPSSQESDFDVELRLTHRLKDGVYSPSPWKKIRVQACSNKTPPLSVRILLREAINVDKESRLPDDTLFLSTVLDFSKSAEAIIPLDIRFQDVPRSEYPKGISIWAVQGLFKEIGPDSCLKDIQVLE